MNAGDDPFAPRAALYVEDTLLLDDITSDLIEVTTEQTADLVAKIELTIKNSGHRYTDARLFAEGNEVEVWMGYGTAIGFLARGEIVRPNPTFPSDGIPTLSVTAYDRSYRLGRQEVKITGGKTNGKKSAKESGGVFEAPLGNIVKFLLGKHGIEADVDPAVAGYGDRFIQKKGDGDLATIRALANLTGCEFFVEYDPTGRKIVTDAIGNQTIVKPGRWVGRFRKAEHAPAQDKTYTFTFMEGQEDSTLLEVSFDWGLPDAVSEIQVQWLNPKTRQWEVLSEERTKAGKSPKYGKGVVVADPMLPPGGEAPDLKDMAQVKIAAAGHSVEVLTRPFPNAGVALAWARDWMARYRDSFIIAKGTLPGVDSLRVGQTHVLDGVGRRYSGEYYFTLVKHRWSRGGYVTEFVARKVIT